MAEDRLVLFVDCYADAQFEFDAVPSSMAIGYGVTASNVICQSLLGHGFDVVRPLKEISPYTDGSRSSRLSWLLRGYARIAKVISMRCPDLIFVFHAFSTFPVELRRILREMKLDVPIVGYTHGSHWDASDSLRLANHPGLEMLDLANYLALDRVLLGTNHLRTTIAREVERRVNPRIAAALAERLQVVGIPLDTKLIDSFQPNDSFSRPTITFNHAPIASKGFGTFIDVIEPILARHDVNVMFTRAVGSPLADGLSERYAQRIMFGNDMALADYYRSLWMSDIQVSTALHESVGVATLEAMYTGNCCLLPWRGSYPEICGGNLDVLYRSTPRLIERLEHFLTAPEHARSVGEELSRRANTYSAELVMPKILSVIDGLRQ